MSSLAHASVLYGWKWDRVTVPVKKLWDKLRRK